MSRPTPRATPFFQCTGRTSPNRARRTLPRPRPPVPNPTANPRATPKSRELPHRAHTHVHLTQRHDQTTHRHAAAHGPSQGPAPATPPLPPCRGPRGEAVRGDRKRPTGQRGVAATPPASDKCLTSPPRPRLGSHRAGALSFASPHRFVPQSGGGYRRIPSPGRSHVGRNCTTFPVSLRGGEEGSHNPLRRPEGLGHSPGLDPPPVNGCVVPSTCGCLILGNSECWECSLLCIAPQVGTAKPVVSLGPSMMLPLSPLLLGP